MATEKETVVQCELQSGQRHHTAFIPAKFAKIGKNIRIDGFTGEWTVKATYTAMSISEANERSQDHAHQREASDV